MEQKKRRYITINMDRGRMKLEPCHFYEVFDFCISHAHSISVIFGREFSHFTKNGLSK